MGAGDSGALLPFAAERVADALAPARRILILGAPGTGKSSLQAGLAAELARRGQRPVGLSADPGTPAFGPPGAVALATWADTGWELVATEPLCTLNAGRFRLPLVAAVRLLACRVHDQVLLVDAPGVLRGVAAAELLPALAEAAGAETILLLCSPTGPAVPAAEMEASGLPVRRVASPHEARRPGRRARARARTAAWEEYLQQAVTLELRLDDYPVIGTPPPREVPEAWRGRQIALLASNCCRAFGEISNLAGDVLTARLVGSPAAARVMLVRDARRGEDGYLESAPQFGSDGRAVVPPGDVVPVLGDARPAGHRPVLRVGAATVVLLNGVFGDPLLHIRLRHLGRSLLFDLGEAIRLPARIAHQVTDVCISHAHADHIGGFLWLLRSRIGDFPPCRIFGPPGLAEHVEGLVRGIRWDRVGERGPRFVVAELHERTLRRYSVQAGCRGPEPLGEMAAPDGVLSREPLFELQAVTLDHGTPVLAFAFLQASQTKVRKERLVRLGQRPGPWLTQLKSLYAQGALDEPIQLPDGACMRVAELAGELLFTAPGETLVYATDFADTRLNRERIVALAAGAEVFFCEAPFTEADAAQARRTGHLTTLACGEIANEAGVIRLVPFHFSRRYEREPERVYAEVRAVSPRALVPR